MCGNLILPNGHRPCLFYFESAQLIIRYQLILEIQESINKISQLKKNRIQVGITGEDADLLGKLVSLQDKNAISITETGSGIQFSTIIMLSLFSKIIDEYQKAQKKGETLKNFNSVMIFDEPEIHLHPFAQKNLVRGLLNLSSGNDPEFKALLGELFEIENFSSQIIIVTHSPDIITENYKQLIRFYPEKDTVKVVCGKNINMGEEEKHLHILFQFIKEVIFAKGAIIVEGDSEYACMEKFSEKMGESLESESILVIKSGGADSIKPLISLLNKFCINAVGIIDNDKMQESLKTDKLIFNTETKCFESEIVGMLLSHDAKSKLNDIIVKYKSDGLDKLLSKEAINKRIKKYKFTTVKPVIRNYKLNETVDAEMTKLLYITWLDINKNIILSNIIADELPCDQIPDCYKNAISKIIEITR